ncbi:MAG: hypothetical protein ABL974_06005 [Prosthecobacter sp.]
MPAKSFFESLFGGDTETHQDGGSTERFESGDVINRDSNGDVVSQSDHESTFFGFGPTYVVHRDGDGNEINRQLTDD